MHILSLIDGISDSAIEQWAEEVKERLRDNSGLTLLCIVQIHIFSNLPVYITVFQDQPTWQENYVYIPA